MLRRIDGWLARKCFVWYHRGDGVVRSFLLASVFQAASSAATRPRELRKLAVLAICALEPSNRANDLAAKALRDAL